MAKTRHVCKTCRHWICEGNFGFMKVRETCGNPQILCQKGKFFVLKKNTVHCPGWEQKID